MSATLTWYHSGFQTKSGTTVADFVTDLAAMVNANSGDADFAWEVASSNLGSDPYYVNLKRKDASDGRILVVVWDNTSANYNEAIFNGTISTDRPYIAFFPAGNVDTPSNLGSASGTIMGDDTGAHYVCHAYGVAQNYTTNYQMHYFDSAEAIVFGFQNPAGITEYMFGAGYLVVDANDNTYPATFGFGSSTASSWSNISGCLSWISSDPAPNTISPRMRVNYGGNNKLYFNAWDCSGSFAAVAAASSLMVDTGSSEAYFLPMQLMGQTRGEGFALKWRQIAIGPPTTGSFEAISTTGPTVQARSANGCSTGDNSSPWFTNFKL